MDDRGRFVSGPDEEFVDEVFSALADERRRLVVWYLQASEDGIARVGELAEYAIETGVDAGKEQLEVRFHHVTLPRLAETRFVEYDARTKTVRYRESPRLERVLSVVTDDRQ